MIKRRTFLSFALCAAAAAGLASSPLRAATVQYKVTVNTTSISNQGGLIELQFNQANAGSSLAGTAVVTGFSATGLTADSSTTGGSNGVTGSFTSPPLSIPNNVSAANYFDQGVTKFGAGFSFLVAFTGPVSTGTAPDPSGFYVFLLDPSFNPLVATGNSNSEVANIILNGNGSVTTSGSAYATVLAVTASPVPEPASLAFVAGTISIALALRRRVKV